MSKLPILAATPVFKSPGTMPLRYVLVDKGNEYVVWTEIFDEDNPQKHNSFHAGSYFRYNDNKELAFANAYEKWMQRAIEFQAYINGSGTYSIILPN